MDKTSYCISVNKHESGARATRRTSFLWGSFKTNYSISIPKDPYDSTDRLNNQSAWKCLKPNVSSYYSSNRRAYGVVRFYEYMTYPILRQNGVTEPIEVSKPLLSRVAKRGCYYEASFLRRRWGDILLTIPNSLLNCCVLLTKRSSTLWAHSTAFLACEFATHDASANHFLPAYRFSTDVTKEKRFGQTFTPLVVW